MSKYLFIGGAKDGEWVSLKEATPTVRVPSDQNSTPKQKSPDGTSTHTLYIRVVLRANVEDAAGNYQTVYARQGISSADVLTSLINNYNSRKSDATH